MIAKPLGRDQALEVLACAVLADVIAGRTDPREVDFGSLPASGAIRWIAPRIVAARAAGGATSIDELEIQAEREGEDVLAVADALSLIAAMQDDATRARHLEHAETSLARPQAPDGGRVANATAGYTETGKLWKRAIPMRDTLRMVEDAVGVWPRSAASTLFAETAERGPDGLPTERSIRWLSSPTQLFAWLREVADVRWFTGGAIGEDGEPTTLAPPAELYEALVARGGETYALDGVELLPHWPPVDRVHYVQPIGPAPDADGSALEAVVDLLNPATPADRDLLRAMILTPAWGGPPGARPAFVLTSEHGRGAGKTTTAAVLGAIYGGLVSITEGEHADAVRKKLVDPANVGTRVVLLDNVRGIMRDGSLEDLITAKSIQGHRLYRGAARVPNRVTYVVTANSPTVSQDLAQRAVVIRLGEPKPGGHFEERLARVLADRRAIIADVIATLRAAPAARLEDHERDRWGLWQRAVLERFRNAGELAERIRLARREVDEDSETAEAVADALDHLVAVHAATAPAIERTYGPADAVCVSSAALVELLHLKGLTDHHDARRASGWMRRLMDVAPLRGRLVRPSRQEQRSHLADVRGWKWIGPAASPDAEAAGGIIDCPPADDFRTVASPGATADELVGPGRTVGELPV